MKRSALVKTLPIDAFCIVVVIVLKEGSKINRLRVIRFALGCTNFVASRHETIGRRFLS